MSAQMFWCDAKKRDSIFAKAGWMPHDCCHIKNEWREMPRQTRHR